MRAELREWRSDGGVESKALWGWIGSEGEKKEESLWEVGMRIGDTTVELWIYGRFSFVFHPRCKQGWGGSRAFVGSRGLCGITRTYRLRTLGYPAIIRGDRLGTRTVKTKRPLGNETFERAGYHYCFGVEF